jgi:hypothetical protein
MSTQPHVFFSFLHFLSFRIMQGPHASDGKFEVIHHEFLFVNTNRKRE